MGVEYVLVNNTRGEYILFSHIPASKKRELAGCPISAAITTWYMLEHLGDSISFVSDDVAKWPFSSGSLRDLSGFREVTDEVVDSLIESGILRDEGKEVFDEAEPDVYIRRLRNIWWRSTDS